MAAIKGERNRNVEHVEGKTAHVMDAPHLTLFYMLYYSIALLGGAIGLR
jgi:hypothetical protein